MISYRIETVKLRPNLPHNVTKVLQPINFDTLKVFNSFNRGIVNTAQIRHRSTDANYVTVSTALSPVVCRLNTAIVMPSIYRNPVCLVVKTLYFNSNIIFDSC